MGLCRRRGSGRVVVRLLASLLDLFPDFVPMDRDVSGGINANLDLIALDVDDQDADVVTDHDLLVAFSGYDEHDFPP